MFECLRIQRPSNLTSKVIFPGSQEHYCANLTRSTRNRSALSNREPFSHRKNVGHLEVWQTVLFFLFTTERHCDHILLCLKKALPDCALKLTLEYALLFEISDNPATWDASRENFRRPNRRSARFRVPECACANPRRKTAKIPRELSPRLRAVRIRRKKKQNKKKEGEEVVRERSNSTEIWLKAELHTFYEHTKSNVKKK